MYLAMDLETTRLIVPEDAFEFVGPLPKDFEPLGVTCGATAFDVQGYDGGSTLENDLVWFGGGAIVPAARTGDVSTLPLLRDSTSDRFSPADAAAMLRYMRDVLARRPGCRLATFNGVSFDLRLLAAIAAPDDEDAAIVARNLAWWCVDPCLQLQCERGFPVGLAAMCAGMGVAGKSGEGADAPVEWNSGDPRRRAAVLAYCFEDVRATLRLFRAIERAAAPNLTWISKRTGKPVRHQWHDSKRRLRACRECLLDPYPDVAWMFRAGSDEEPARDPISRSNFCGWLLL